MIRAVIFDMDGVLLDNMPLHVKAWIDYCEDQGLNLPEEDILHNCIGRKTEDFIEDVLGITDPNEQDRLKSEKNRIYFSLAKGTIKPLPGLVPFLALLKEQGIKIVLGSAGAKEIVDFNLKELGIAGYFDHLVWSEMVSKGKPDPEVYLLAADLAGADPEDCVVFEDAKAGVEAATAAGMRCIGVATSYSDLDGVMKLVDDFTGVSLSDLD